MFTVRAVPGFRRSSMPKSRGPQTPVAARESQGAGNPCATLADSLSDRSTGFRQASKRRALGLPYGQPREKQSQTAFEHG